MSLTSQHVEEEEEVRQHSSTSSLTIRRLNSIPCACDVSPMPATSSSTPTTSCDKEASQIAEAILVDVLTSMFEDLTSQDGGDEDKSEGQQQSCLATSSSSSVHRSKPRRPADIEIDCTHPEIEIRVSPRHRRSATLSTRSSEMSMTESGEQQPRHHSSSSSRHHHRSQETDNSSSWSKSVNESTTSSSSSR